MPKQQKTIILCPYCPGRMRVARETDYEFMAQCQHCQRERWISWASKNEAPTFQENTQQEMFNDHTPESRS